MLVVKTVIQTVQAYEVPDVMTGDFLRWLAANSRNTAQYLVNKEFMNEMVVNADRRDDPPSGADSRQEFAQGDSRASVAGASTE